MRKRKPDNFGFRLLVIVALLAGFYLAFINNNGTSQVLCLNVEEPNYKIEVIVFSNKEISCIDPQDWQNGGGNTAVFSEGFLNIVVQGPTSGYESDSILIESHIDFYDDERFCTWTYVITEKSGIVYSVFIQLPADNSNVCATSEPGIKVLNDSYIISASEEFKVVIYRWLGLDINIE